MKPYYICVTPFFPTPTSWRGAYVLDQVKAIKRNSDYEVVVFTPSYPTPYELEGIKVYAYKARVLPSNVLNGIFNGHNGRAFVRSVKEAGIDPQQVAIVHCHVSMHAACGLALKQLNPQIKVLLQHHDLDPFNLRSGVIGRYNRWNIRFKVWRAQQLYNQVDLHVCISEACKASLLAFPRLRTGEVYDDYMRVAAKAQGMKSVSPRNTYVLYNGVDTSLFAPQPQAANEPVFRIGCIGNFCDLKDHMTLIKAFELFAQQLKQKQVETPVKLSLLGTGETRALCEAYIADKGLEPLVEWPCEVNHNELPHYYQSLNLFVLPSYFEGFGCVYTEAAACGVPFMGCVNQGYSEYVSDPENWLVEPHDYVRLAELMERYFWNRNEQRLCHSYDINELIKQFINYLEKI